MGKQMWGFPGSSASKESAYNARDPGLIPGLGRSTEEGIGYPLQYSGASLVAHLVKNPSAMQETWVQSLGWDDPLEKGMATFCSILACREFHGLFHGVAKSQTQPSNYISTRNPDNSLNLSGFWDLHLQINRLKEAFQS